MWASPLVPRHAQPIWMGGGSGSRQMMQISPCPIEDSPEKATHTPEPQPSESNDLASLVNALSAAAAAAAAATTTDKLKVTTTAAAAAAIAGALSDYQATTPPEIHRRGGRPPRNAPGRPRAHRQPRLSDAEASSRRPPLASQLLTARCMVASSWTRGLPTPSPDEQVASRVSYSWSRDPSVYEQVASRVSYSWSRDQL